MKKKLAKYKDLLTIFFILLNFKSFKIFIWYAKLINKSFEFLFNKFSMLQSLNL